VKITGLTFSKILATYTTNPKLIYLSLPTKQLEFTLTESQGWSTKISLCPFCSVYIEHFQTHLSEKGNEIEHFIKAVDSMNKSYGSIVVQELLGRPQYVPWLHGQPYPIAPKRIWMLSFRDGLVYPITQAQCKEFHERDAETMMTVPSEPLLEHVDAMVVFEYLKIFLPELYKEVVFE
jgi:hypothetical protein